MIPLVAAVLAVGLVQPESYVAPLPRQPLWGAAVDDDPAGGSPIVGEVSAAYTAGKTGLKQGDVLVQIGANPIKTRADLVRTLRTVNEGDKVVFKRDGKTEEATLKKVERPRDPGSTTVEVLYDQVVSHGERMRTIITKPKKAGKHPVMFYMQGISYSSMDVPLGAGNYVSTFLDQFAEDYVTLRVDKPGCGDSEGTDNAGLTFWREIDIYVQALRAIRHYDFVDADRIYIFGHSMGGVMVPIVAAQEPVAGVCAYGTLVEPWGQYMIRNSRRQSLYNGATEAEAEKEAEDQRKFGRLFFEHGLDPNQALKADPSLQEYYDRNVAEGGKIYTMRSYVWQQQLGAIDMASYWRQLDCPVLSLYGEADFICFEDDHERLAQVSKKGTYKIVEDADHLFYKRADHLDSIKQWLQGGEFNLGVMTAVRDWIKDVEAGR